MDLQSELLGRGFKRINSNGGLNSFSSIAPDGCFNTFVKGGITVCYGLSEVGKPPTLLEPLPFDYSDENYNNHTQQTMTERGLKQYGVSKVIDAIENNSILFVD